MSSFSFKAGLNLVTVFLGFLLLAGAVSAQSGNIFGVNDDLVAWNDLSDISDSSAKSSYAQKPNATLIGSAIQIANANSTYQLLKPDGTDTGASTDSGSLSTSNISADGRYTVNDTSSTSNSTNVSIDILRNYSDVTGRAVPGDGSLSLSKEDIVFRYWVNKSKIKNADADSTIGDGVDVFRANLSENMYWVGIEKDGWSRSYDSYHKGQKPRLNDIFTRQSEDTANISVLVRNYSADTSNPPSQEGIEVRIRRMSEGEAGRNPYITAPPTLKTISSSKGWANFTDVPYGRWDVDVTNSSVARNSYTGFQADIPEGQGYTVAGSNYSTEINVTHWTGDVTGQLEGERGSDFRYALGAMDPQSGRQFIKIGVEPGSISFNGLPNGSYRLVSAKFDVSGQGPSAPEIGGTDVKIETDKTSKVNIGFPATVKLNGTVYNSSSAPKEPVKNVKMFLFNRTDAKFEQLKTDSNGEFSGNVANNTVYNVKLIPPKGTDYKITDRNITVNGSGSRLNHNFSFQQGAVLKGYVTDNGNGLDADVRVWNGSEKSYGFDSTNASGYYEINGLEPGKYHRVSVYTSKPGVSDNTSFSVKAPAAGDSKTQDFKFGQEKVRLGGNITNGNGKPIDVDVNVINSDIGLEQTNSSGSNGFYNFTDLPRNTFYRVKAGVSDSDYVEKEKQLTLFKNTTLDFRLNKRKFVDGYVRNNTSSSKIGSGFRVIATNNSEESVDSATTNASGYYNLTLENINYTVEVVPPGDSDFQSNSTLIDASSASQGKHPLLVRSGDALDGFLVQDTSGNVISDGGDIFLWNKTEDIYRNEDVGSAGGFNFTGLKNTSYNIAAGSDNDTYEPNRTTISWKDLNSDRNIRLHLNKGRSIRVTVKDNDTDQTIKNARVVLGGDQENQTDSSGNALFPRQKVDSSMEVVVEKEDYASNSKTFTVKDRTDSFGGKTDTTEYQDITVNLDNPSEIEVDVNVTKDDASGSPVSDAVVELRANQTDASHKSSGVTGSNGETRLTGLVEGHQESPEYTGGYLLTLATQSGQVYANETGVVDGTTEKITTAGSNYTLMVEVPAQ